MENLQMGLTIDIKRTDGRIHEAVISGLNEATRSVTVEWFEKGETKGKEVELAAVLQVNPHLAPSDHNDKRRSATTNNNTNNDQVNNNSDQVNNNNSARLRPPNPKSPYRRTMASPSQLLDGLEDLPNILPNPPTTKRLSVPVSASPNLVRLRNNNYNNNSNQPTVRRSARLSSRSPSPSSLANKGPGSASTRDLNVMQKSTTSSRSRDPESSTETENDDEMMDLISEAEDSDVLSKTVNPNQTSVHGGAGGVTKKVRGGGGGLRKPQAKSMTNLKSGVAAGTTSAGGKSKLPTTGHRVLHVEKDKLIDENTAPSLGARQTSYNNVAATTTKAQQDAASKRKSVTVTEIERLKKNREERRAQQEELRRQKEDLKNIDPGNPNWEFLGMIREYQETLEFRPLRASDKVLDSRISVCIRKRPLNKKELNRKEIDVVTIPNKDHTIVHQPQTKVDLTKYLENVKFRFDYAFNDEVDNEMVYRFTAQPLVRTIFDQGFATCFAYGQTGSGKTHTMGGDFDGKEQDCARGIYAMTAKDVFRHMEKKDYRKDLYVSCTFFEIYGGKVFDLLNNKAKLRVLEDGKKEVQIVGLTERTVANDNDVLKLIGKGTEARTAGQTSANNNSSRSHAVFQILLRKKNTQKIYGKFSLIDLAGNERGVDTMSSDRQTRMEGAEINKSLLALKECIRAMAHNNPHLPFRASKLTLVLRDSFVGSNSRTCMIAMVSPGMNSCEHTLNTLRYADRVKELRSDGDEQLANGVQDSEYGSEGMQSDDDEEHDSDQDLALVQSRNADALSDDLYNFQLAVNHVQDAEEQAIDEHTKYLDSMEKAVKRLSRLLKTTEKVDYDLDAYASEAAEILDTIPSAKQFASAVTNLQRELQQEDEVVQKSSAKRPKN